MEASLKLFLITYGSETVIQQKKSELAKLYTANFSLTMVLRNVKRIYTCKPALHKGIVKPTNGNWLYKKMKRVL
jgi:hypothetical protein